MRIVDEDVDTQADTQEVAWQLGYLALIPFAVCAVAVWFTPWAFKPSFTWPFASWTLIYGAVFLSFIGGMRWILAFAGNRVGGLFGAIAPALVAWLAVVPDGLLGENSLQSRFAILLIAFAVSALTEIFPRIEVASGTLIRRSWIIIALLFLIVLGITDRAPMILV